MITDTEIKIKGIQVLMESLGERLKPRDSSPL
jgi:hypothetical protein